MRIIKLYKLGSEDPAWETTIDQAFNRLDNFASELRSRDSKVPHTSAKAFNRVVVNREFSLKDWETLFSYGREIVSRAVLGSKLHPKEVAESIDQAALHLRDVLTDFDHWLRITEPERES